MIYLLLALAVLAVLVVFLYNGLITLRNKVNEAWSDIDTQLKRRYDLIPNLVETVKGYASHESETLEKVIQARNTAMNAQSVEDKENAENMLSGALKTIFALAESYPDLKANQNFMQLQATLKEIEEHIQMSRRYYNGTVRDYNTKIQVFPNNLLAKPFGFTEREFFQATEQEKQNVKVSFQKESESSQPTPPTPPAPAHTPAAPAPEAPEAPAAPAPTAPEAAAPAPTAETPAAPTPAPAPEASHEEEKQEEQPPTPPAAPPTPPQTPPQA